MTCHIIKDYYKSNYKNKIIIKLYFYSLMFLIDYLFIKINHLTINVIITHIF